MTGRRRMVTRLTEWIDVASVSPASQHAGADLIFRLHSWYATGTVVPHVEVPDGSDAVSRRSWEAAAAAGFTRIRTGNWPPGVLGLAAVERGIPVLEAEIGGQGMSTAENRCAYVEHLTRLLRHLGIMDGVAEPGPHIEILGRGLVHALAGGMPRLNVRLGDYVEAGSILARITDLHGEQIAEIGAPHAGLIAAVRHFVSVNPGDVVSRSIHAGDSSDDNPISQGRDAPRLEATAHVVERRRGFCS